MKPGPATTCELRNSSGLPLSNTLYAVRHNPAVYYTDQTVSGNPLKSGSGCSTTTPDDLALPAFPSTTPPPLHAFTWISPDVCDDGHSATYSLNATSENIACPGGSNRIANIDAFLQQFLPPLLESPTYTGGDEAIVLWFDSPSGSNPINSTPIPLVVLSAYTLPGTVQNTGYYTHYDLLRTCKTCSNPRQPTSDRPLQQPTCAPLSTSATQLPILPASADNSQARAAHAADNRQSGACRKLRSLDPPAMPGIPAVSTAKRVGTRWGRSTRSARLGWAVNSNARASTNVQGM